MTTKIYFLLLFILPVLFFGQVKSNEDLKVKQTPKTHITPEAKFTASGSFKTNLRKDSAKKRGVYIDSAQHIIYDFKTSNYLKDIKKIKVHTPVIFKIRNINPFFYKITITPKDSIIGESKFDKELLSFITQKDLHKEEEKLLQEQTNASNAVISGDIIVNKDLKGKPEEKKENEKAVSAIVQNEILIKENQKYYEDKLNILNKLKYSGINIVYENNVEKPKPIFEIKIKNDTISTELNNLISKYNEKERMIENNNVTIKKNEIVINEKVKEYQSLLGDFNKKYEKFIGDCRYIFGLLRTVKKVGAIAEIPDLDSLKYAKNYKQEINKISGDLLTAIAQIDEYKKSYSELSESYVKLLTMNNLDLIMEKSGIDKLLAYPNFQKNKADQLSDWFIKYYADEVIKQAFLVTTQLDNTENYTVNSYPFQPENDMVEFKVIIEPRDKIKFEKNHKTSKFIYRQAIYGGTRVDFSLGMAAAYYGKISRYEIGLDNKLAAYDKKFISSSLVGLLTMSYRRTGYIAYGGSAGMGLDVVGGKLQISNFFIGPTILLGKKDRMFFTLGASLKNVRELKDGYLGLEVPVTDDLASYSRDRYKIGMFASLTYSLTKDARALIKNLR